MKNLINFISIIILSTFAAAVLYITICPTHYEGVKIYKNLGENTRHLAKDGYNYGLRWQCVEFVKRYYHDALNHKMPNTYGHAKHFFDPTLEDGEYNKQRDLYQYENNGKNLPEKGDILVFKGRYGHVAIVDRVYGDLVVIYQQNTLKPVNIISLDNKRLVGWLKSPQNE